MKDQESLLPRERIFIKDQRYREISDGQSHVVFDLSTETFFAINLCAI